MIVFGQRYREPSLTGGERSPFLLLAPACAACFTMAFSFACDKAGFPTATVDTQARVRLARQGEGFLIDRIALTLTASVPEVTLQATLVP